MKILLLGKNGQVGWELQRSLAPLGDLLALDRHSQDYCGDLSRPAGLAETLRRWQPDLVVNAAAYTAVDRAEDEPAQAHLVNARAPAALAEACARSGAWLVHYSTDYVFDGSGDAPWREDDPTGPLGVYGQSKLAGEQAIRAACPRHLILRTSWVYAARGANFARSMLRLAQERERLGVIDDQLGAPTGAELIADVTAHAARALVAGGDAGPAGLYHLAAAGQTSWHGYARYLIDGARRRRPDLPWRVRAIDPVASSAYPSAAKRPLNSCLDTGKLRATFGLTLPPWEQGVARMLDEIL